MIREEKKDFIINYFICDFLRYFSIIHSLNQNRKKKHFRAFKSAMKMKKKINFTNKTPRAELANNKIIHTDST